MIFARNNTTTISVLYIDDENTLLEIGKIFLERTGYLSVTTSSDPRDALDLIRTGEFDVIVSDYQMPGMTGIELLSTLRASGDTTPFIIFTGRGREEIVIEALNKGADFYVQKGGYPKAQFAELTHKIQHAASRKEAERRLLESEERHRRISSVMTDFACSCVREKDGRCHHDWMVGAVYEITGYTIEEIRQRGDCSFLIHQDDIQLYTKNITSVAPGDRVGYDIRINHRNGVVRWLFVQMHCHIDAAGDTRIYIGCRDITEERSSRFALKESLQRLERAMDAGNLACWEMDITKKAIRLSKRAGLMLGHPPEMNYHINDIRRLIHPDDYPEVRQALQDHLDGTAGRFEVSCRVGRSDGSYIWLKGVGAAVGDPSSGQPVKIAGIIADINERKRQELELRERNLHLLEANEELAAAEEEMRQQMEAIITTERAHKNSEQRIQEIIAFLPDPTFIIDTRGTVVAWNKKMEELTGIPHGKMLGRGGNAYAEPLYGVCRPMLVDLVMSPKSDEIRSWYDSVHQNGASTIGEIAYRHPDGRNLTLWGKAAPLYDSEGNIAGAIESIRDITTLKEALGRLEEANRGLLLRNDDATPGEGMNRRDNNAEGEI
nr:PAS domain S-box protein [Methanocalculus chunghsingensis]